MISEKFIEQIRALGLPQAETLLQALTGTEPSVSVRLNARKKASLPFKTDSTVPWLSDLGLYLPERPLFTLMPELHQGVFYVQDASSMFIAHVIRQLTANRAPVVYLDACAAPGGKTTAAIDALPAGSLVVANEYDFRRAAILRENVIKWGYDSTVVSRGDTRKFSKLKEEFDIIAADVPCSGEGMFRKDPEAVAQWSPALVAECAERQKVIVQNLWSALRPGGYFIYSTCTFNRTENEDVIKFILDNFDAESVPIATNPEWNIIDYTFLSEMAENEVNMDACSKIYGYRFFPGCVRGEGLFLSVVKKCGEFSPSAKRKGAQNAKNAQNKVNPSISKALGWVSNPEDYLAEITSENMIVAFPKRYAQTLKKLQNTLDISHFGIPLATIKGKDIIPEHSLAMAWGVIDANSFPNVELDETSSLQYLRREAIVLPEETPRGYILLTYNGLPLGFAKNIGNRANNLYPDSWRILKR